MPDAANSVGGPLQFAARLPLTICRSERTTLAQPALLIEDHAEWNRVAGKLNGDVAVDDAHHHAADRDCRTTAKLELPVDVRANLWEMPFSQDESQSPLRAVDDDVFHPAREKSGALRQRKTDAKSGPLDR